MLRTESGNEVALKRRIDRKAAGQHPEQDILLPYIIPFKEFRPYTTTLLPYVTPFKEFRFLCVEIYEAQ